MAMSIEQMVVAIFGCRDRDLRIPDNMRNWFQIEYGKEWRLAYENYRRTGSVHYGQR